MLQLCRDIKAWIKNSSLKILKKKNKNKKQGIHWPTISCNIWSAHGHALQNEQWIGFLRQVLYLQSQWMDFKTLNDVWKLKRFCTTCIELVFQFLSSCVLFSDWSCLLFLLSDSLNPSKKLCFRNLPVGDYSSTFYLFDDKVLSL